VGDALTPLLQAGILGPIVAVLLYALWWITQQHRKDINEWRDKHTAIQEARVNDAQKAVERIYTLKESVDALTGAVVEMRRDLDDSQHPTIPPSPRR
jgi:hypothetical protein